LLGIRRRKLPSAKRRDRAQKERKRFDLRSIANYVSRTACAIEIAIERKERKKTQVPNETCAAF
jgi:hypothetical protein